MGSFRQKCYAHGSCFYTGVSGYRKALVGTGLDISLLCTNQLSKHSCHLVKVPSDTVCSFHSEQVFSSQECWLLEVS